MAGSFTLFYLASPKYGPDKVAFMFPTLASVASRNDLPLSDRAGISLIGWTRARGHNPRNAATNKNCPRNACDPLEPRHPTQETKPDNRGLNLDRLRSRKCEWRAWDNLVLLDGPEQIQHVVFTIIKH